MASADAEHAVVGQRRAPHHQADRPLAVAMAGQRQRAAVEQVDQRRVAQQQRVGGEEGVVAVDQRLRCAARRSARSARAGRRSRAAPLPCARSRSRRSREQLDVVGGADRFAAADAQRDARVVLRLRASPALAVPGPALGGGDAAAALQVRGLVQQRQVDRRRWWRRRRAARRARARTPRPPPASSASSISVRGSASRHCAQRPRSMRARGAPPALRAAAPRRAPSSVIAHAVSSVVDSGMQPSVGVSRCGVLEADQALQRGRDADRAAGVRAERGPGRAAGHR